VGHEEGRMGRLLGLLLLLQVCSVASNGILGETVSPLRPVEPTHLPRFAFGREHRPIRIPLVVNVFLVNIDYHADNAYTAISATELEELLMDVLPEAKPSCIETGEPLHVTYDLWYHVAHVDLNSKAELEAVIKEAMVLEHPSDGTDKDSGTTQP